MTEKRVPSAPPSATAGGGAPPLVIENLVHRFGGVTAVDGVSLEVGPEERVAVIGPNGAGKTTLFRLIAGEFVPSEGTIRLFGQDVTRFPVHKRARLGLSRTFQVSNLFLNLTALENVRVALQAGRHDRWKFWGRIRPGDELEGRARELLAQVGIDERADVPTSDLSHGEQRQLEIAVALATDPKFLLLDEPAAGLSAAERALLRKALQNLPRRLPFLLIEHDMSFAMNLSDRVLCLDNGRPIALGPPDEVRADPHVKAVYLGRAG
ncbi:MAG: ABC transporter ATP-binding protein [Actinomycetes bacterium]|nr:ABC transporter ATP-binding protein [Acidimicrobiia bacterium]